MTEFKEFPGRSHYTLGEDGLGRGRRLRAGLGGRSGRPRWTSDLDDKVAVVTGAGKGIGLAIDEGAGRGGRAVVAGSRSDAALDGLDGVTAVAVDLATPEGAGGAGARAIDDHGRLDVLVNNVGAVRLRLDGFLALTDDDFEWAMQLNFFIALRATRAAIAHDGGAGRRDDREHRLRQRVLPARRRRIDYGAAKAAVVNLTKSLAQEFGPQGIRVNSVSPGPVATDLWLGDHGVAETVAEAERRGRRHRARERRRRHRRVRHGRFTTPEEVADLVVMLASERTGNVTGANYVIDGGLIKTT